MQAVFVFRDRTLENKTQMHAKPSYGTLKKHYSDSSLKGCLQ